MTEINRVRELAGKATPGPWDVWSSLYEGMVAAVVQYAPDVPLRTVAEIRTNFADAQYIAAANPTFVTALLDRLERAEKALTDIGRRAMNQEGDRTFDECIRDLGWIDDECRRLNDTRRPTLLAEKDYPS